MFLSHKLFQPQYFVLKCELKLCSKFWIIYARMLGASCCSEQENIARIAKRCPSKITSVVNMLKVFLLKQERTQSPDPFMISMFDPSSHYVEPIFL